MGKPPLHYDGFKIRTGQEWEARKRGEAKEKGVSGKGRGRGGPDPRPVHSPILSRFPEAKLLAPGWLLGNPDSWFPRTRGRRGEGATQEGAGLAPDITRPAFHPLASLGIGVRPPSLFRASSKCKEIWIRIWTREPWNLFTLSHTYGFLEQLFNQRGKSTSGGVVAAPGGFLPVLLLNAQSSYSVFFFNDHVRF